MRRTIVLLAAAALLCCGLPAGAVAAAAASRGALQRVSPPDQGYSVELPPSWRFANASYPSDHATHLWFDPANALRKMIVVLSACVGCAQSKGKPNPLAGVPAGATHVRHIGRAKVSFECFTADDPWVAEGISEVARQDGVIDGYVSVELWLPPSERRLATAILDSFQLSS